MPEIKHNFSNGRMNKDLDERLVPNGEYRDAMNIQVRTTDGGDDGVGNAGAIQNISGNTLIGGSSFQYWTSDGFYDYAGASGNQSLEEILDLPRSRVIASISDEKNDKAYFFVAGLDLDIHYNMEGLPISGSAFEISAAMGTNYGQFVDSIIEVDMSNDSMTVNPVVVDVYGIVLTSNDLFNYSPNNLIFDSELSNDDAVNYSSIRVYGGVWKHLRPGMKMECLNSAGIDLFKNAEIHHVFQVGSNYFIRLTDPQNGIGLTGLDISKVIFSSQRVLNFNQQKIINGVKSKNNVTGINIVDNLLFWTDNESEPKKINIDRCKQGTFDLETHTILMIEDPNSAATYPENMTAAFNIEYLDQNAAAIDGIEYSTSPSINNWLKEEHVTVKRKAPTMAPTIQMKASAREEATTVVDFEYSFFENEQSGIEPGDEIEITSPDFTGTNGQYREDDILIFTEQTTGEKCVITFTVDSITTSNSGTALGLTCISVFNNLLPPNDEIDGSGFWTIILQDRKPLFELSFGRFAYRYKYEDGEYSSFSPWSEIAFLPGRFDFDHKKGYNLGMRNNIRELIIKDFIPHQRTRSGDVTSVDILYKTTDSPNCYVVKSVQKGKDPEWTLFTPSENFNPNMVFGQLEVTSEMIHRALPANQLLRSWDNVPKKALAQEVVANRVIYGNYTQGYDIKNNFGLIPGVKNEVITDGLIYPKKSVKSFRDYKVGVVFGDKYGRETPVISPGYVIGDGVENNYESLSGDINVDKRYSSFKNTIQLRQDWNDITGSGDGVPEDWIYYAKYYIKETSNEFYNLVMDRWYDARDGNVWISFNSADRNKLDEETYLLLKNEHGNNEAVIEEARYKIISIDNDAPDYIKYDPRTLGKVTLTGSEYDYMFTTGSGANPETENPDYLINSATEIVISEDAWGSFMEGFEQKGILRVRICGKNSSGYPLCGDNWQTVTQMYTNSGSNKVIRWKEPFGLDSNMLLLYNASGIDPSGLQYLMEFREDIVENRAEFDGKFFVKIQQDDILNEKLLKLSDIEMQLLPTAGIRLAYIDTQYNNPSTNTSMPRDSYRWMNTTDSSVGAPSDQTDDFNTSSSNVMDASSMALSFLNESNFEAPSRFALGCYGSGGVGSSGDPVRAGDDTRNYWMWWNSNAPTVLNTNAFVDSARAANFRLNNTNLNGPCGNRDYPWQDNDELSNPRYYKPTGWDQGYLNTGSIDPTPTGQIGRVAISPLGTIGLPGTEIQDIYDKVMAESLFRFDDDTSCDGLPCLYKPVLVDQMDTSGVYGDGQVKNYSGAFEGVINDASNSPGYQLYEDEYGVFGSYYVTNLFSGLFNDQYYTINEWAAGCSDGGGNFNNSPSTYGLNTTAGDMGDDCITCENSEVTCRRSGFRFEFRRVDENFAVIGNEGIDTASFDPKGQVCHDGREALKITFLTQAFSGSTSEKVVANASCWETEPKENVELDLYYEASNAIPMKLNSENTLDFAPYNSKITAKQISLTDESGYVDLQLSGSDHYVWAVGYTANTSVIGIKSKQQINNAVVETLHATDINIGDYLVFEHKDGTKTMSKVTNFMRPAVGFDISGLDGSGFGDVENNTQIDNLYSWPFVQADLYASSIEFSVTNVWPQPDFAYMVIGQYDEDGGFDQTSYGISSGDAIEGPGIPTGTTVLSTFGGNFGIITVSNPLNDYTIDLDNYPVISITPQADRTGYYEIESDVWQYPVQLGWHNCYSFGNGVESDRIRDDYNAPTIDNGVKVSTTFVDYGEEKKLNSMIYSGIYNSTAGVNNLNEFNMAEKITKDINPSYGSIQALKTRDTDVVILAEDKILKVTANKDALYNADGNPQLLASNRVLGTVHAPFVGDYGISKNPESLVSDQFRMYFTDKQRGAVLRLSRDGITPISEIGMKTWFRENLSQSTNMLGTFDTVSGEYNLTLKYRDNIKDPTTISFNEKSKGWVSFKSFIPDGGLSVGGKYITGKHHRVFKHYHQLVEDGIDYNRNTFYQIGSGTTIEDFVPSHVTVLFNDMPGSVKSFKSVGYEGSQAKVSQFVNSMDFNAVQPNNENFDETDGNFYNLTGASGWYIEQIKTDIVDISGNKAPVGEFINKEGKWFNFLGGGVHTDIPDSGDFSVQGIGQATAVFVGSGDGFPQVSVSVTSDLVDNPTNTNATYTDQGQTYTDGSSIGIVSS